MRILFLSDVSIERVIGGAERVLHEQSTRLAKRGHEVYILTRLLPEHEEKSKLIEMVREFRYNVDYQNSLSFIFSTRVNAPVVLSRLLEQGGIFNIVNGHQPFTSWAFLGTPFARRMPFVYTCHSLAFEEFLTRRPRSLPFMQKMLQKIKALSLRRLEKDVLRRASNIIVLSEYTKNKLRSIHKIPEERIHIIPGGVDTERFRPLSNREEVRSSLHLPLNRPVFITVRNLVPRMGLENLLTAAQEVRKFYPEFTLIIGGTGPLKDDLEGMTDRLDLKKHVLFTGFIAENELPLYLGVADYFLLPTVNLEGFGLVTVEALACGTPVIGTTVGGTVEILSDLDRSLLVSDTTPMALASSMINHLEAWEKNKESYLKLRDMCRNYAEQKYSWEANINKTEELFYRAAR